MRSSVAIAALTAVLLSCGAATARPDPSVSVPSASVPSASPTATATPIPSPSATPSAAPTPHPPSTAPPSPTPTPVAAAPYCRVADVPTPNTAYDQHVRTYLDWTYTLPRTYIPPDLVLATTGVAPRAPFGGIETMGAAELMLRRGDPAYTTLLSDAPNAFMRAVVHADLQALRTAAKAAGHTLVILSAYRSYDLQQQTFDYWTRVGGYEQALRTSARPGHSEHQLGTTIDFGDGVAAPWEYADWATTPVGEWLAANAAGFGFVMTYPKGATAVTCYDYEPWHYRYVGREVARALSSNGLPLREHQRTSAW